MSVFTRLSVRLKRPGSGLWMFFKQGTLLWGIGGFLVAFGLGFVLFFPLDQLARQAEQRVASEGDLQLQISDPGWGIPPGLTAGKLSLSGGGLPEQALELTNPRLTPLWGSLFSGNPGGRLIGQFFGGELTVAARRQGQLELSLTGARLDQQPVSPQLSILLSGNNGELQLDGTLPTANGGQGTLELSLEQIELSGMRALGSNTDTLAAGTLQIEAELNGTALTFKTLQLNGGDLELTGRGSLLLGARPQLSRINLSLVLKPGPDLDPQLRDLLTLLSAPESDGSIQFRLLGSLASPQLR